MSTKVFLKSYYGAVFPNVFKKRRNAATAMTEAIHLRSAEHKTHFGSEKIGRKMVKSI